MHIGYHPGAQCIPRPRTETPPNASHTASLGSSLSLIYALFPKLALLTLVQTVESSSDPLVQGIQPIFACLPVLFTASVQAIQKARALRHRMASTAVKAVAGKPRGGGEPY